jgi:hypothetical protein
MHLLHLQADLLLLQAQLLLLELQLLMSQLQELHAEASSRWALLLLLHQVCSSLEVEDREGACLLLLLQLLHKQCRATWTGHNEHWLLLLLLQIDQHWQGRQWYSWHLPCWRHGRHAANHSLTTCGRLSCQSSSSDGSWHRCSTSGRCSNRYADWELGQL